MDDQDGVKFEADGPGLDIPNAGEEQCAHELAVGETVLNPMGDGFNDPIARGVFEQLDQWFDGRFESDGIGGQLNVGGAEAWEFCEETERGEGRERELAA